MPRNKSKKTIIPRFYLGKYRLDAGLSQNKFAEKLDMNASKYNELENGKRGAYMDIRLIIKMVEVLNVDLVEFAYKEKDYRDFVDKANGIDRG